ncbi:hypothetical protein ES707_03686 [subsurface metagenome]
MVESEDFKNYIEDFKKKIRKKVKSDQESKSMVIDRSRSIHQQTDFSSIISPVEDDFYSSLNKAEQNANIGLAVPSFNKLFLLKRIIYRWITKFLFKILKVITINQRNFNLSVLDTFRSSIDDHNNLKLRFAETKTQFDTRIIELKIKQEQQDIEIFKLNNMINYLKNSLTQLEQRINSISEDTGKGVEKASRRKLQNLTDELNQNLDSLYVFLEDNLRGSRQEIKKRLQVYLPIIKKAKAGSEELPILDIGSGRGEWLELLKENNLNARGLDLNQVMVRMCRERGLNVIKSEALSFLKSLPDCSLGAVTGFHLIEHYGFEFLVKLLGEILRVLKPGGIVIFETPNPGNVLVGSCNFYLDPTHNKPLPSSLIRLVLESRGFSKVQITPLNPYKDDFKIKNDGSEISKRFNDYFYGPQDYSVVGYKI